MQQTAAAISAYGVTEAPVRTEKSVEYQAFATVTSKLKELSTKSDPSFDEVADAIYANRKLWTILAADVASDENELPVNLRAQIFSLSLFVGRESSKILNRDTGFETLIEINRSVMRGLRA